VPTQWSGGAAALAVTAIAANESSSRQRRRQRFGRVVTAGMYLGGIVRPHHITLVAAIGESRAAAMITYSGDGRVRAHSMDWVRIGFDYERMTGE
jgi:hypothetical protein